MYTSCAKHILRFETLQADFSDLLEKYQVAREDSNLPRINTSKEVRKLGISDLTLETVKQINQRYQRDFEKFNYDMIEV